MKSQIHAGGSRRGTLCRGSRKARGAFVRCKSLEEVKENAKQDAGPCHLVTKQSGAEGKEVKRLYIEERL